MDSTTSSNESSFERLDEPPSTFLGPPKHPDELGTLGRYRVLRQLGAGGMGVVFLGYDEALDRKVALKVMLPHHAAKPTAGERFLREARSAAKARSDHIITCHEVGEANGVRFIAMEYLLGQPLDQFLKSNGNPSVAQILRIGREVATGLADAHALGLVHRDIKPANLWLEAPRGRVKILDFGLARSETDDIHLTQSGTVVGTPAYMSPEQARGKLIDSRSDLFSLGGVLYRLCTGRLAFPGDNQMEVLSRLALDEPTPVTSLNPAVPEPLAKIIHNLLAKNPADRPSSAEEVARAIGAIESSVTGTAAPLMVAAQEESRFSHLDDSRTQPAGRTGIANKPTPTAKTKSLIVGGLVIVVVLIALASMALMNKDQPKAEEKRTEPETVQRKETPKEPPPKKAEPVKPAPETDLAFFNGKDLAGWDGDPEVWKVVNGELIGAKSFPNYSAISTLKPYSDFEWSFKIRHDNPERSPPSVFFRISAPTRERFEGPYLQISPQYGLILKAYSIGMFPSERPKPRINEFNAITFKCVGRKATLTMNGVVCHTDGEFELPAEGHLGFQIGGGDNGVTVRDMKFKDLSPSVAPSGKPTGDHQP